MLKSLKTKEKIYIGSTGDLQKRLKEHNEGKSFYTSRYKPWILIYCESFISEKDARNREKAIKYHGNGLALLMKRLKYSIKLMKGAG